MEKETRANNKNFMEFIRSEVAKKGEKVAKNPMVEIAVKDFDDTSMKICRAIDSNDKETAMKYLTEVTIKLETFVKYAWALKFIDSDELLAYKYTIDKFNRETKEKFNNYFEEKVA